MKRQIIPFSFLILANLSCSLVSANIFDVKNDAKSPGLRGRARNGQSRKKGRLRKRDYADNKMPGKNKPSKNQNQGNKKPGKKQDQGNNNPSRPSQNSRNYQARIIGGSQASQSEYPFIVSMQDRIGHFCGGSLITRDVVLSAAHCQGAPYDIVAGQNNLNSKNGQSIAMRRELPHPRYNDRTTDNDFMLVFLKSPVTLNSNVKLIKPNKSSSSPSVGSGVTVMGWGDTDSREDSSKPSDILMEIDVDVISNQDCDDSSGTIDGYFDSYKGQITQNMVCARANRKDACQGDSGGPLIQGNAQVGVVSWGIGCASRDFPGVYARVSRAYEWIEREVCKGSEYAEAAGFDCSGASYDPSLASAPSPSPPSGSSGWSPSGGGGGWSPSDGGGNSNWEWDDDWEPVSSSSGSGGGSGWSPSSGGGGGGGWSPSGGGGSGKWDWDDDWEAGSSPSGNNKPPKPPNNNFHDDDWDSHGEVGSYGDGGRYDDDRDNQGSSGGGRWDDDWGGYGGSGSYYGWDDDFNDWRRH